MGAYRTGKSFFLDLMLRYMRTIEAAKLKAEKEAEQAAREAKERAAKEYLDSSANGDPKPAAPTEELSPSPAAEDSNGSLAESPASPPWVVGDEDRPLPDWLRRGDEDKISEGHADSDRRECGFIWRGGDKKCTEGIWVWSKPFMFKMRDGRSLGVLIMDTQGAWDDTMTEDQSATIFGLTALMASKLIYNIQNRIEEGHFENLDYFTTFAQSACAGMPGSNTPFGHLEVLIRDWAGYEDGWTVDDCKQQVEEHLSDHLSIEKSPDENARMKVARLENCFSGIKCFGLSHPGLKVTKKNWGGDIKIIEDDFVHLADHFFASLFQGDFPRPSAPLGFELSVSTFKRVLLNFVQAFRDKKGMGIGLRDAFVNNQVMTARDELTRKFEDQMRRTISDTQVIDPTTLESELESIRQNFMKEFSAKLKPFKLSEVKEEKYVAEFMERIVTTIEQKKTANDAQVEAATMKIVASPVVCYAGMFLMAHTWLLSPFIAVGAYFQAKKWSARKKVDMVHPAVLEGIWEDALKFVIQRWKDVQAIGIAAKRLTAHDLIAKVQEKAQVVVAASAGEAVVGAAKPKEE
eukprot:gnl/TRDRNA2_/TRDRNA2_86107_c1_seq1.p1 gnl/TRDRNA2_/TRDRNA2_86107_c1~~gnl/TRDRNA2_/TRDRNA2_86107_c1_seq1.p1  ORF type:complete len:591 (+),score=143.34 gnl/TRDRNA2_/TRDRNA2_86107_c1_seq1:46-1773(+)